MIYDDNVDDEDDGEPEEDVFETALVFQKGKQTPRSNSQAKTQLVPTTPVPVNVMKKCDNCHVEMNEASLLHLPCCKRQPVCLVCVGKACRKKEKMKCKSCKLWLSLPGLKGGMPSNSDDEEDYVSLSEPENTGKEEAC